MCSEVASSSPSIGFTGVDVGLGVSAFPFGFAEGEGDVPPPCVFCGVEVGSGGASVRGAHAANASKAKGQPGPLPDVS